LLVGEAARVAQAAATEVWLMASRMDDVVELAHSQQERLYRQSMEAGSPCSPVLGTPTEHPLYSLVRQDALWLPTTLANTPIECKTVS
jgi:hypothetical protein